jgi:hypothetical protein
MSYVRRLAGTGISILALLLTVSLALAQMTPGVTVSDQAIENGALTVDQVVSDGPGWIVIHADDNGSPGTVIGHAAVKDGENDNVQVEIDVQQATETLYAMLHSDTGTVGTYEFPGGDPPVQVDGQVVVTPFTVTGGLAQAQQATATPEATAQATAQPTPGTLPQSGGRPTAWPLIVVSTGVLSIAVGFGLNLFRRPK